VTRVYLPATLGTLADAVVAGRFEAGYAAHAVTPAIREWYVEGDAEELEYAALTDAAQASLRLLAAEVGTAQRYANRRVVVAADVEDAAVAVHQDEHFRSAVHLTREVGFGQVVSVHLDGEDDAAVRSAVADAAACLPAADAGDDDARFALDEAESHELLWYDVTEIADLI
jgi:hypothetical protein